MRQAALAGRAGEALLNRTDDAGRPVADHEQRIAEPSGAQVLKERSHRLDVLSRTGHQSKQRFAAILADSPGGQHSLPPLTRSQTLGDAVDEQVGDGMLGEIALAEVFVLGPKLLGDLAHRRPRQKPPAGLVGKRVLDVAGRQASRVKLDRQPLEFPRSSRKRRPHARDKRFGRVADLRSRIVHCALRRLHLARPIAIPVARFLALAAFITPPAKHVAHFAFERLLDDQAQRQMHQIASPGRRPQVSVHQGAKLLARTRRRG